MKRSFAYMFLLLPLISACDNNPAKRSVVGLRWRDLNKEDKSGKEFYIYGYIIPQKVPDTPIQYYKPKVGYYNSSLAQLIVTSSN